MNNKEQLEALQDIRKIMLRNDRFISLSGWSGISAGLCALVGAYFVNRYMHSAQASDAVARNMYYDNIRNNIGSLRVDSLVTIAKSPIFMIAIATLFAALFSAAFFTFVRARATNNKIWTVTSRKLFFFMMVPLSVGGLFIIKLILIGNYDAIAASCLIFYGLALLSASRYSTSELLYLALVQFLLGIVCLYTRGTHLPLWALGFGVFHIIYGIIMWYRYERITQ